MCVWKRKRKKVSTRTRTHTTVYIGEKKNVRNKAKTKLTLLLMHIYWRELNVQDESSEWRNEEEKQDWKGLFGERLMVRGHNGVWGCLRPQCTISDTHTRTFTIIHYYTCEDIVLTCIQSLVETRTTHMQWWWTDTLHTADNKYHLSSTFLGWKNNTICCFQVKDANVPESVLYPIKC